jgi:hypothetical protein
LVILIVDKPYNGLDLYVTVTRGEVLENINDYNSSKAIFVIKAGTFTHIEISDSSFAMG